MMKLTKLHQEYDFIYQHFKSDFSLLADKSIVVCGASGLIGTYLCGLICFLNKVYQFNTRLTCIGRNLEQLRGFLETNSAEYIKHDLTLPLPPSFVIDSDFIIYAASNNYPAAFASDPTGTLLSNIIGVQTVLQKLASSEALNTKFLYISSGEVYGSCSADHYFSENEIGKNDPMDPRSCYPLGKITSEALCCAYGKQFNLNTTIARLSYVFGPTYTSYSTKADVQFISAAVNGRAITMKSSGSQIRTYTYVGDIASALIFLLLHGEKGQAYNVSNQANKLSIKQLAETIASHGNVKISFTAPSQIELSGYSKSSNSILSSAKLMNLGWLPLFNTQTGVQHTIDIARELYLN